MFRIIITIVLYMILTYHSPTFACSVIKTAKDGNVFVGNNEDWGDTRTKIWFIPSSKKEYGRICFGFEKAYGFVQGGMNEKGLVLDALATGPTGWKPDPKKRDFTGQINDHILAKFATVNEVKKFFQKYNVFLGNGEFMVADESGKSMIIEYVDGDFRFIESNKFYQIATNFVQFGLEEEDIIDHRYNVARKIIEKENEASLNAVRKALSAIHAEFFSPTIYSYICNLKTKKIHVYNFHNFEESYEINLLEELKKGKHHFDLPSLFSIKTEAALEYENIAPKRGTEELAKIIENNGINDARNWFNQVKDAVITAPIYNFEENAIVKLGYNYLNKKEYDKAIEIFTMATEVHPNAYNTWDSLAEGYLRNGDTEIALKYYNKSLELNKDNQNAREQINRLMKK